MSYQPRPVVIAFALLGERAATSTTDSRRQQSRTPESIINEIGGSLATCYDWALLNAARDHYGFQSIEQPSNASIFHTPRRWAEWLNTYGPLWVVIVGAPHAVVVAGIRGNLDNAGDAQVKILIAEALQGIMNNNRQQFQSIYGLVPQNWPTILFLPSKQWAIALIPIIPISRKAHWKAKIAFC